MSELVLKNLEERVVRKAILLICLDNRKVGETTRVDTRMGSARSMASRGGQHKRTAGDIVGTRNGYLGMVPKLLTDARKTSYWFFSFLLTAECPTVELPGICKGGDSRSDCQSNGPTNSCQRAHVTPITPKRERLPGPISRAAQ
jgi:hypothetical protein